jgi:hypothetical protein
MKPYDRPNHERLLIVLDRLNNQKLWRKCDGTSAECGTFSPVGTQGFGPPGIVRNMRRSGLSTTGRDGHPARREDSSPPIQASLMRYVGTWRCSGSWQKWEERVKKTAQSELESVGLLSLKIISILTPLRKTLLLHLKKDHW